MVIAASWPTRVAILAAARPATRTRPAAIRSAACARERARPRRTISASSRALVAICRHPRVVSCCVQFAEHLDQLTVDSLEDRLMLGHGQLVELAKPCYRGVHPRITSALGRRHLAFFPRRLHGLRGLAVVLHVVLPPGRNATVPRVTLTPLEALARAPGVRPGADGQTMTVKAG